jgi:ligand-binding SRPBCC domain-containing protein
MHYELTDEFDVSATLDQAWAFFSNAANLPAITPPWLGFVIRTPESVIIQKDAIFDYTIRVIGIPMKWKTKILDWQPPTRFVDLQIKGPYALWHHEHRFTPLESGGIRCFDRVIYQLPLGLIGRLMHAVMVKRQLIEVFRYRRSVIGSRLGGFKTVQADVQIRPLGSVG